MLPRGRSILRLPDHVLGQPRQYPVLELVISEEEEEPATDFLMGLLIEYRIAVHGDDEDSAMAWIEAPAFQKAYVEASHLLTERNARSAH